MIKTINNTTVSICCGKANCPTVEKIDENHYKITDDDGNSIVVKKEELKLMGDAVTVIDKDQQLVCG